MLQTSFAWKKITSLITISANSHCIDFVFTVTLQFAVTAWKCRWTEILWRAASCPPWRGSNCGSCAPPFRPCCTATSAIPTTWSPTPFKTESSSLYSWSCLTTRIQTRLFRTTTVRARWTNDTENFLHDIYIVSAGWYRRSKTRWHPISLFRLYTSTNYNQDSFRTETGWWLAANIFEVNDKLDELGFWTAVYYF